MKELATAAACLCLAPAAHALDINRPDVQEYVNEVVRKEGLDADYLLAMLEGTETQQAILDAMAKPAERTKPWREYRAIFITPDRIQAGVEFWKENEARLKSASERTGVPAEILAGIVGVETYFGRRPGKFRVLDSLATLAFDYPPRGRFFRSELTQLFLLARDDNVEIDKALGSYAGAMGAPQFIPSSYRQYAVDGDGDGRRDLFNDWDDVLASVANYFVVHKWEAGAPVVARGTLAHPLDRTPDDNKLATDTTVAGLTALGVRFSTDLGTGARRGSWFSTARTAPNTGQHFTTSMSSPVTIGARCMRWPSTSSARRLARPCASTRPRPARRTRAVPDRERGVVEQDRGVLKRILVIALAAALAACASAPPMRPAPPSPPPAPEPGLPSAPPPSPGPMPAPTAGNPPFYEVDGVRYTVLPDSAGYSEQGVASWYGREFHGKRTSSGEVYDMYALTAAHKTLPLPTTARVTSLTTGKSIIVRINDRGPFRKGRLIDLSYGAARELGFLTTGTDRVEVQALTPVGSGPVLPAAAERAMYVQVGAFRARENAEEMKSRLERQGLGNIVIRYDARSEPALYRVRVGPVADAAEYDAVAGRVIRLNIGEPRLVTESAGAD